ALADVRRRAAHALFQPRATPTRTRRGTTGLAVAIAALAVPMLPNPALGAASTGADPIKPSAPQTRHHLNHDRVEPEPGTMTVQEWAASGWTLTVPDHPADMGLLGHILATRHHGHYVPWLAEPARVAHANDGPGVPATATGIPANGRRPVIDAFRVSHTSPRAEELYTPESQAAASLTSAPAARSRTLPNPLVPAARPANTKQMLVAGRQSADIPDIPGGVAARSSAPQSHQASAAADPSASPCLREDSVAGNDRQMVAHLHPATDAMDVVVTHRRTPCTAMVDYLSQARA
ncbi:hypothetical protein KGQ20_09425, partial [Catenulispora sp. NF23]|uniref:hypothetical protein n=1 Tax=Catenulispora pinistramenti TaxID=2705254 RepID=UPI001BA6FE5C